MNKTIESLLRGYVLFDVNGQRFSNRWISKQYTHLLYTTPYVATPRPQRPSRSDIKPLTDEQIRQVMKSLGWIGEAPSDIDFARAIEAKLRELNEAPQRTWVNATTWRGLTDEDKKEYVAQDFGGNRLDAMDWAEKRLKDKNT